MKKYRWDVLGKIQRMKDKNDFTRAFIFPEGNGLAAVAPLGTCSNPMEETGTSAGLRRWCERITKECGY